MLRPRAAAPELMASASGAINHPKHGLPMPSGSAMLYDVLQLIRVHWSLIEPSEKIPGDRLVLGMLSAFRALVWALSKNRDTTCLQSSGPRHS